MGPNFYWAPPRLDEKVIPALTDDQIKTLLKACQGKDFRDRRDGATVRLMLETAARAGECAEIASGQVTADNDERLHASLDSLGLPRGYAAAVRGHRDTLTVLRTSNRLWTYLSPAEQIGPGEHTARYRVGGDQPVIDSEGRSRTSFEDTAIALLDGDRSPALHTAALDYGLSITGRGGARSNVIAHHPGLTDPASPLRDTARITSTSRRKPKSHKRIRDITRTRPGLGNQGFTGYARTHRLITVIRRAAGDREEVLLTKKFPRSETATARKRGGLLVLAAAVVLIGTVAGIGIVRTASAGSSAATALDRFTHKQLAWGACESDLLDRVGAQCANVTVPLDYREPLGRTISVAISRVRATDPSHRRGIMLSNPGGPGAYGLDLPVRLTRAAPSYPWGRYDLIGMDPRGVGRSTPVHCGWPIGDSFQSAGVDSAGFVEAAATQADLAQRCLATDNGMLPHITTRNTARDIDLIRTLLGEDRINYFGMSYGTYLGAVYTEMFPDRTDRMVLDSAVDPGRYGSDVMIADQGAPSEDALDALADWTAARADRYRLGSTRAEVRAVVSGLIEQAARQPIRIGSYEVDDHWLPSLLFGYLHDSRRFDEAANALRQIVDAAAGQPAEPSADLEQSLSGLLHAPTEDAVASMESSTAVVCGDVNAQRDPGWYQRNVEASRAAQPVFGPLVNNISPCAFWPAPVEPRVEVHNATPVLIVQATGDPVAAYQEGVGLHRTMTASRLVTLQDVIVHGAFTVQSSCMSQAVETYLRDGDLPASDLTCHAD